VDEYFYSWLQHTDSTAAYSGLQQQLWGLVQTAADSSDKHAHALHKQFSATLHGCIYHRKKFIQNSYVFNKLTLQQKDLMMNSYAQKQKCQDYVWWGGGKMLNVEK